MKERNYQSMCDVHKVKGLILRENAMIKCKPSL